MIHEEKNDKPNYFAILPADVRYSKEISPSEKLLYAEISSLTSKEGYCWASNKYFADLYEVDISTIERWMKKLSDKEFIFIETKKNGFQWDRKIFLKNILRTSNNAGSSPQKCGFETRKNAPSHSIYINNKKNKKERGAGPPAPDGAPPSRSDFSSEEKKIERGKHVATTQKEHEKLVNEYGDDLVKEAYECLSLWKIDTPKSKWKKHDYLAVRRWAIDAAKENRLKRKEQGEDPDKEKKEAKIIENKVWILNRLKNIHFKDYRKNIENKESCVYIRENDTYMPVSYLDENFREIIESTLKKWGLT